jgi:hypothetical protein
MKHGEVRQKEQDAKHGKTRSHEMKNGKQIQMVCINFALVSKNWRQFAHGSMVSDCPNSSHSFLLFALDCNLNPQSS